MSRDPRVDEQIAKAPAWAAAILVHLREAVHRAAPDVTEDIKWGRPFFLLGGRPFAMLAHFKAHCVFGFWRMGKPEKETEGGGQYGRITSIADLPDEATLRAEIEAAAHAARTLTPTRRATPTPRPAIGIPPELETALLQSPAARAGLDGLPPGARREYWEWIAEAKRPETKAKRIETAVAQLADGKKLHWKI